jgi:hypothetical protein
VPKVRYPNVVIGIKKEIARKNNKIATKLLKTSWSWIRSVALLLMDPDGHHLNRHLLPS